MAYENLAGKYRPQTFSDIVGQGSITKTLSNALKLGRIAHAYLFFGPRGCGKTTMARLLAKAVNCGKMTGGEPCNRCVSCLEIAKGRSIDVLEIDAASHTQVDKIREVIIDTVSLVPGRDKFKIFILDEVHMLSSSSFNALLKTVEEPPEHVLFIMATTEQSKIPATIISRCQSFRFKPLTMELIAGRLKEVVSKEKLSVETEALAALAEAAAGSMRDGLTLLDRAVSFSTGRIDAATVAELVGHAGDKILRELAFAVLKRDGVALHGAFGKFISEGHDVTVMLRDLRNLFARAFLAGAGFSGDAASLAAEIASAAAD
ncbi:MAG: DNA polymerase III subunit gamma/tau, partial [bacterium]